MIILKSSKKILSWFLILIFFLITIPIPAHAADINSFVQAERELVTSFPGYEVMDVYTGTDPYPYVVFSNGSYFRVVDSEGNIIRNLPTNGREFVNSLKGFIVTKTGNQVWLLNISTGSQAKILDRAFDDILITDEGMVAITKNNSYMTIDGNYDVITFRLTVAAFFLENGSYSQLYNKTINLGNEREYYRYSSKKTEVLGAAGKNIAVRYTHYDSGNTKGKYFYIDSSGNKHGGIAWGSYDDYHWGKVSKTALFVFIESGDPRGYLYIQKGSQQTSHYSEDTPTIKLSEYWAGDPSTILLKEKGTNAGTIYKLTNNYNRLIPAEGTVNIYSSTDQGFTSFEGATSVWDHGGFRVMQVSGSWFEPVLEADTTWFYASDYILDKPNNLLYIKWRIGDSDLQFIGVYEASTGELISQGWLPIPFNNAYWPKYIADGQLYTTTSTKLYKITFNSFNIALNNEIENIIGNLDMVEKAQETISTPSPGWYRFAAGQDNCKYNGSLFKIRYTKSGKHGVILLWAGITYGQYPTINVLGRTAYGDGAGIEKARLVYGGTYDKPYLEFYVEDSSVNIEVEMLGNSNAGWSLQGIGSGSIPSGYTFEEANLINSKYSVDSGTFEVRDNGKIYTNGKEIWHQGNDGPGSGLDADTIDGSQPSVSQTPNTIVKRDSNGYIDGRNITEDGIRLDNAATYIYPIIKNITGKNNATITTNSTFTIVIDARGAIEYRVQHEGFDSGWVSSNEVTITGLSSGNYQASTNVQTKNVLGNIESKEFTFFVLQ